MYKNWGKRGGLNHWMQGDKLWPSLLSSETCWRRHQRLVTAGRKYQKACLSTSSAFRVIFFPLCLFSMWFLRLLLILRSIWSKKYLHSHAGQQPNGDGLWWTAEVGRNPETCGTKNRSRMKVVISVRGGQSIEKGISRQIPSLMYTCRFKKNKIKR